MSSHRYIHRIIVDPVNPDIIYAGAIGNPVGTAYREGALPLHSTAASTWKKILFTNETSGVADMVMDPSNPGKIFVAMWDHQRWPWFFRSSSAGSGLWLTRDGGETFTEITAGLPEEKGRIGTCHCSIQRPDYVYAYVESQTIGHLPVHRRRDLTGRKEGEKNIRYTGRSTMPRSMSIRRMRTGFTLSSRVSM
ncbi:MAG: hypothetical protein MZV63_23340 [Marinilabiliales bacterium]|nr:hypothetical protein [Marinilabiliales bacterium]